MLIKRCDICLEEVTKGQICFIYPNLDHLIERIWPKFRLALRTEEDKQSREVAMFSESPVGYHEDEERLL